MPTQKLVFLLCLLISFFSAPSLALSVAGGSSCSDAVFPNNRVFASCTDLPNLDSFLHWTYTPSSSTLHIAYRHSQISSSTWVAWGINPTSKGMIGTQAIVAYPKPDGTVAVFTSPVDSYGTQLREGNLTFRVSDLSAMFMDNEMVIFATIELPVNTTSVNHVWQDGPVSGDNLGMHGVSGNHLQSMGNLNLSSGQAFGSHGGNSKTKLKIAHGVLNAVSWGIMMPLGFMAARYLKALGPQADPLWFYTHVSLQLSGYFLGMAGGATGLVLGGMSSGNHHPCHMGIGSTLFALGLLQISALFLRPAKDHKNRHIWNWFHHLTGYLVLVLSLVNIWVGFTILKPAKGWMIGYGSISGAIMLTSLILEVWKKMTRDGKINGAQANVNANTETGVSACLLISFFSAPSLALSVAGGSSCSNSVLPNNQVFASCTDLPNLDSFLHWTYTPSSSTLHIAYRHSQVSSSSCVAWGINPTSEGMIGTQASNRSIPKARWIRCSLHVTSR
ncbi:hypothetical protein RHSIM_Rhsim02G0100600 [Rhododendron simsii]|uniref:Cytochrome b561 and DOMON domain-containing protein n=1 Tax=Rhododendron simsii TaxID=118357 RepID=A0A834HCD4_RHOSS|nr:hypothetical protein RHSIM_Rhsim02G0100600 [Rhododendron simsii]